MKERRKKVKSCAHILCVELYTTHNILFVPAPDLSISASVSSRSSPWGFVDLILLLYHRGMDQHGCWEEKQTVDTGWSAGFLVLRPHLRTSVNKTPKEETGVQRRMRGWQQKRKQQRQRKVEEKLKGLDRGKGRQAGKQTDTQRGRLSHEHSGCTVWSGLVLDYWKVQCFTYEGKADLYWLSLPVASPYVCV